MKHHPQQAARAAAIALAALTALTGLAALPAHALAPTTTLAGWNTLGGVIAAPSGITLTTAFIDETPFNLSGSSAADINFIASAAGVSVERLDFATEQSYEGSLIGQSFAVAAGQSLTFNWSFSSLDADFLDRAFVVIDGTLFTLATTAAPGASTQAFAYSFASEHTAKLAIGVVDTGDFYGVSTLKVSGLALAGGVTPAPVPEPSSWALLAAGLGAVGWVSRRRGISAEVSAAA